MTRLPYPTQAFNRSLQRLGLDRGQSPARLAVVTVMHNLLNDDRPLPLDSDEEMLLREADAAFVERYEGRRLLAAIVRKVPGHRLYVWYRSIRRRGQEAVEFVLVTSNPGRKTEGLEDL